MPDEKTSHAAAEDKKGADLRKSDLDLARLRKIRKGLRLTQAELANLLGIHRTYLVLIEKGKKVPSPRLERSIEDFLMKAEKQTFTAPALWQKVASPNAAAALVETPVRKAPVVSWAAAGLAKDYEDLRNYIDEMVETDCKDSDSFAIIIEGDSMEEKFYAGDRVVFAPHLEPRNGDAVVAKLNDGRVFFKYFQRTGPEGLKIKLVSENPNYGPVEIDRGDAQFIYPAWEVKRRVRK